MRFITLSMLLLAGCVGAGRSNWEQPSKSEQDMHADLHACTLESRGERPMYRGDAVDRCMRAKGWR